MPISQINTNSIANGAVVAADLAAGSVTNEKIDTVAASKLTGTVPLANGGSGTTTGQGIVPLQVVQLSGLASFSFSIAEYPQYIIYLNNIGGSVASANLFLRASNNGGSSYVSTFNFRTNGFFVNGATDVYAGNDSGALGGLIWAGIWDGSSPSGTNGYATIAGTSYYGINKRFTCSSVVGGQTQSNQGVQIGVGQTQDDSKQYNFARFELSSGTFRGSASALICGIKAF
jgi:hypothetical protein